MARLTLCLIAKNEERMLPGCLASVRGVVDEIVLVDTGSTDRTKELARAAGAKIFDRPWDEDFAAPRNLAAKKATGDWILQLDADERLAPGSGKVVRAALKGRPAFDVGFLRLHNARSVDAPVEDVLSGVARHGEADLIARLIRRTPDLAWEGLVHENIVEWAARHEAVRQALPAHIIHLGYDPAVVHSKEKRQRNLQLLWRRVELEPDSIIPLGYIAVEGIISGDFALAGDVCERAWALLDRQPPHRQIRRICITRAMVALRDADPARIRASVAACEAKEGPNPDGDFLRGCADEIDANRAAPGDRAPLLAAAVAGYRAALARLDAGAFEQVMAAGRVDVLTRLATVLLSTGAVAEATRVFEAARAAGAGERLRLAEAEALLLAGDPGGALKIVEPALNAFPDGWILAARAAAALGALDDARLFLDHARARLGRGCENLTSGSHRKQVEAALARRPGDETPEASGKPRG